MDDPDLQSVGFFRRREHPVEGAYFEQAAPVKFGAGVPGDHALPPLMGQDGDEIRAGGWKAFD